eukprot:Rhum_TRINITY_DN14186_c27_g1::Rhum_TRINITY_DN14186_c27_g1_i1::g.73090::m.73090
MRAACMHAMCVGVSLSLPRLDSRLQKLKQGGQKLMRFGHLLRIVLHALQRAPLQKPRVPQRPQLLRHLLLPARCKQKRRHRQEQHLPQDRRHRPLKRRQRPRQPPPERRRVPGHPLPRRVLVRPDYQHRHRLRRGRGGGRRQAPRPYVAGAQGADVVGAAALHARTERGVGVGAARSALRVECDILVVRLLPLAQRESGGVVRQVVDQHDRVHLVEHRPPHALVVRRVAAQLDELDHVLAAAEALLEADPRLQAAATLGCLTLHPAQLAEELAFAHAGVAHDEHACRAAPRQIIVHETLRGGRINENAAEGD